MRFSRMAFVPIVSTVLVCGLFSCQKSGDKGLTPRSQPKQSESFTAMSRGGSLGLISDSPILDTLTNVARLLGIKQLSMIYLDGSQVTYELTAVAKKLNGTSFNFDKARFNYSLTSSTTMQLSLIEQLGETTTLDCNSDAHSIYWKERDITIVEGVENDLTSEEQNKISTVVALYKEVTDPTIIRLSPIDAANLEPQPGEQRCTTTAVAIKDRRSNTLVLLNNYVDGVLASHPGCKRLYGIDIGCLWGDFACVATQEIECSGNCP